MSPSEGILQLDTMVLLGMNALAGNWLLDWTIQFVAQNKLLNGTVFIAAYWYYWFAGESRHTVESRRVLLAGLVSCMVAIIVARALADLLPFRVRPLLDSTSGFRFPAVPVSDDYEEWSSFPSDKAAFVFALSFGLYAIAPRIALALAAYAAIAICLPRVWLGVHYPSDVLVGALIGASSAWICQKSVKGWMVDWLLAISERWPAWFYAAAFIMTVELAYMFDNVRRTARAVKTLLGASSFETAVLTLAGLAAAVLIAGFGAKVALDWRSRRKATAQPR